MVFRIMALGNKPLCLRGIDQKDLTEEGRPSLDWAAASHGVGSWTKPGRESECGFSLHLSLFPGCGYNTTTHSCCSFHG